MICRPEPWQCLLERWGRRGPAEVRRKENAAARYENCQCARSDKSTSRLWTKHLQSTDDWEDQQHDFVPDPGTGRRGTDQLRRDYPSPRSAPIPRQAKDMNGEPCCAGREECTHRGYYLGFHPRSPRPCAILL